MRFGLLIWVCQGAGSRTTISNAHVVTLSSLSIGLLEPGPERRHGGRKNGLSSGNAEQIDPGAHLRDQ